MNVGRFVIDRGKKIYLYGENPTSFKAKEMLIANKHNYGGIIDIKYGVSDVASGIIAISDISKWTHLENIIVIICLSDGIKHEKIAQELHAMGVENIIYYPTEDGVSVEYEHLLRKAYVDFTCGDIMDITYMLPNYSMMHENNDIIRRTLNNVHFYCDIKYLHTATEELFESVITATVKQVKERFLDYEDIPLIEYRAPIEMFHSFLEGSSRGVINYLNMYRKDSGVREQLFNNRKMLVEMFETKYENDRTFFEDSPCRVVWNDGGYFNVIDGIHRALYLYVKGKDKIPVVCSANDYDLYQQANDD